MRNQLIMPILLNAAQKLGLNILVEPTRGIYGVILFENGKKFYVKDINLNLNLVASASLARNKAATSFFLQQFGYNVPAFTMIFNEEKCTRIKSDDTVYKGLEYVKQIGFPVVLKPNDMSQGSFVFKANDENEYFAFASAIFKVCETAQVQKFYSGNDYRIVVLGDKILSAYQRVPFYVMGDGSSSISALMDQKQQHFIDTGRDTKLAQNDMRLVYKLAQQGLSFDSIPRANKKIDLQDISNLSVGGETIELTDQIHPSYAELAFNIARDMNLVLCGIDIITPDFTQPNTGEYTVIEVNSSPGLDNYAYPGQAQERYVEELYSQVLLYIKHTYG